MFIARQPIFNRTLDVYGYELLFRADHGSKAFDGTSDINWCKKIPLMYMSIVKKSTSE